MHRVKYHIKSYISEDLMRAHSISFYFCALQGTEGFEKQMNRLMDLTAYQVKKMKEQKDKYYLLVDEPECTNVCYWYVPERLRPRNFPQAYTRDWHIELGKVRTLLTHLILNNVASNSLHQIIYPHFLSMYL